MENEMSEHFEDIMAEAQTYSLTNELTDKSSIDYIQIYGINQRSNTQQLKV
jgi:hypothetical protein